YAEEFYNHNLLGYGTERNGILLILSMEEREYDLCAFGADAHAAFTDYGKEVLSEEFLDDFAYDDWYWGFYDYIAGCEYLLSEAAYSTPVDTVGAAEQDMGSRLLIVFVPALLIALIVCLIFLSQMKTARRRKNAAEYVSDYGTNIYIRQDIFTHRTTQKRVIEKSSGGGGTSVNRGGFSHRGGKF
ncbi:MAG: TPM domain-containing protein, partial [Oscillospiraceae bacterium]|nr:TPM domain-containing protein [Oscillospiraceae bacterium]